MKKLQNSKRTRAPKNIIHENMSKSAKEFEEYLIQLAINQTIELEKIKAFRRD